MTLFTTKETLAFTKKLCHTKTLCHASYITEKLNMMSRNVDYFKLLGAG